MSGAQVRREVAGVALLLLAVFIGASLAFGAGTGAGSCTDVHTAMGPAGACLRSALVQLVGLPAAVLVSLIPAVHALRLFGTLRSDTDRSWLLFLAGMVVLVPLALGLVLGAGVDASPLAGTWGGASAFYLHEAFGPLGAWIALVTLLSVLTVATLAWNPVRMLVGPRVSATTTAPVAAPDAGSPAARRRPRRGAATDGVLEPTPEEMPAIDPSVVTATEAADPAAAGAGRERSRRRERGDAPAHQDRMAAQLDASAVPQPGADELPSSELLAPPPPRNADAGREELDEMGVKLKEALGTFRVEAEIVGRTTGPVVTQFEVEPAPGVKVRQIANLANDLALAMRATSIRIVAPIPGRGAVGVEVPNPTSEIVALRELIESREFQGARAALPIALGKDLEGSPVVADLAKMPHLLIAGATGSGKSVCVNTIISSLVFRHTPRTLRLFMVDPKMVELSVYDALPHLRHSVITDSRDAAGVLKWCVGEMQKRYELLAANGCRNIQDFNRRVQQGTLLQTPATPDAAFEDRTYRDGVVPYIVVVIDELADLMMTVQGEVERPLALLAQKARAIGVHLILATQRPSVNVITGLIKANFPSRIAFRVASQVDSRTIIDGIGAESLLGNGDMLFIPPSRSEPIRMQGAYIASEDTERLLHWYKERRSAARAARAAGDAATGEAEAREPDVLEMVRAREAAEAAAASGEAEVPGERDRLFREAAEVVIQHQLGSTSLLQRRLKVGYGRAARIIDQLHDAGVLGPPDGSRARDVLAGFEDLDRICGPASRD